MSNEWTSAGTAKNTRRRTLSNARGFELCVVDGPDAGRKHLFGEGMSSLLVGQSALCAFRLTDAQTAARHCSFELRGDRLCLIDLSPEKTTRVNGVLAQEAYLVGGEVVRIGATTIAVRRIESGAWIAAPQLRSFGRIQGESPEMLALYPLFAILAERRELLVIEGERGAGKRVLAEELHAHGPAKDGPFVTLRRDESRALADRLVSAYGGTLYIEEGGVLEADVLVALAGIADVRVIVGTRGDAPLPVCLRDRVKLPALRDRDGDVAALARMFWTALGGEGWLPHDFLARFEEHRWPGNIRELRMAVYDRVRHGGPAQASDIHEIVQGANRPSVRPDAFQQILESDLPFAEARAAIVAELEQRYVDRALERANNNVARAAANSGIAHRYFQVLKSRRKCA